ncbi:MAG: preprotein translocase subunit SecG [Oscillospiraceae bacterium]|jgi:preprotein translocase subunit SecG|nr:preprotein translocase subunit SecG [Oscillospiraceae bacterium]
MSAVEIILGIILMVFSVIITVMVLMQEGHEQNVGVITGGADTFLSKNQARSIDSFLARWTKFFMIGFFVLVVLINAYMFFFAK